MNYWQNLRLPDEGRDGQGLPDIEDFVIYDQTFLPRIVLILFFSFVVLGVGSYTIAKNISKQIYAEVIVKKKYNWDDFLGNQNWLQMKINCILQDVWCQSLGSHVNNKQVKLKFCNYHPQGWQLSKPL